MKECIERRVGSPAESARDALDEVIREGAQRMLTEAIKEEVEQWVAERKKLRTARGQQAVVRNGHMPVRTILTGVGPVEVQQPRVRDRRSAGEAEPFRSKILPPYLRKTRSVEELIPWLYLKGISTGDFTEALAALLGPQAPGLSATTIVRLKAHWEQEYRDWSRRSLQAVPYVYVWADGVYFNVRLESEGNDRQCILVLIGATAEGRKELIALADGYRELSLIHI